MVTGDLGNPRVELAVGFPIANFLQSVVAIALYWIAPIQPVRRVPSRSLPLQTGRIVGAVVRRGLA
jgi:hypothetical protein